MNTAAQQVLQHAIAQRDPDGILSALDMGANPYQGSSDTPSPLEQLVDDPQQVLYMSAPGAVGDKYKMAVSRMLSIVPGSHHEVISVQRASLSAYRQLSAQRTAAHLVGARAQALSQPVPTNVRAGLDNSVTALGHLVGVVEQSTAFKCLQQEQGLSQVQQLVRQAQTTGAQEGSGFASSIDLGASSRPAPSFSGGASAAPAINLGPGASFANPSVEADAPSYDRYSAQVPKLTAGRIRDRRTQPIAAPDQRPSHQIGHQIN